MKQKSSLMKTAKKVRGKRDWVKNAIIIFLAVLLVLTFFSNTIMNYSLPEVAAQYPLSTTITTKIRGSGTVEAAQTYHVQVQETRTVASLSVKVGDKVEAGQTLLTLDETESTELQEARTAYANLKLEYDKMLLDKGDQNNATAASLQQAKAAVSRAENDLANARQYESNLKSYQSQEASAQSALTARQQEQAAAERNLQLLENEKEAITTTNEEYLEADRKCTEAQNEVSRLQASEPERETDENGNVIDTPEHMAWQTQMNAAEQALNSATSTRDQLLSSLTLDVNQRIANAKTAQINAAAAVTEAQNVLSAAQTATQQYQASYTGATSVESAKSALQSAQDALASLEGTNADQEETEQYEEAVADLDTKAKAEELKRAEETVKELEEKTSAAKIVSRYAGVVKEINVAAGDTTSAETPLMVVELTEKGYTLTATVKKEQAKTLREGLTAEITNLWDSGITMTLTSITADKADPANNRTLTFAVQGDDVSVGQQLSFSIGDKNASFDVVIPSSAVHTDADGSFVYTVVVKSSPLGNRYTVKKTAVTVLASDETNTAVSGELSTADFVVTTATVPIQPGDQIRIAE